MSAYVVDTVADAGRADRVARTVRVGRSDAGARVDLNLVRVFVAVFESRSLTVAASRLFVTQPAVSQSLARLRRELDDPLFEREGRVMRPTPLAESLFPAFQASLAGIDRALAGVRGFDPGDSQRVFRLALSELGEIGWLPAIVRAVRAEAPGARVEVAALDLAALPDWLARGTIDLAITADTVVGGIEGVAIKTEAYGVLCSMRHPRAATGFDLGAYRDAAHVALASDSGAPVLAEAQARAGVRGDPRVALRHVATLPALLAENDDLVATIPGSIAAGFVDSWPLVTHPLPFEMAPVELRLHRRATTQHAAALDWFHDTVAGAVRGSPERFGVLRGEAGRGVAHVGAGAHPGA